MADKDIEQAYLNLARSIHHEFPPGDPLNSETPDFRWPNQRLGLEVRRLFQAPAPLGFPPSQVEGFQQRVIRQAEKLYRDAGGLAANVVVNFAGQNQTVTCRIPEVCEVN